MSNLKTKKLKESIQILFLFWVNVNNKIVSKKIRDQDIESQLLDAFKIINGDNDSTQVDSEMLKEYLMTMGNKLSEEQADEIIKEFNSKGDKTFEYPPIVSKLMKR